MTVIDDFNATLVDFQRLDESYDDARGIGIVCVLDEFNHRHSLAAYELVAEGAEDSRAASGPDGHSTWLAEQVP